MTSAVKVVSVGLFLLGPAVSAAQDAAVTFEIVSIKRSPPNAATSMRRLPGGQVIMTNRPLAVLLPIAWPDSVEVSGMPSWMNTEMYDVVVKPPVGVPAALRPQMYRHLLVTRMKLAMHVEPKEVPSFALVLDRRNGRLGPKLRPSTLRCEGAAEQPLQLPDVANLAAAAAANCGLRFWMDSNIGRMVSGGILLDQLAKQLGPAALSRPVTNETNLQGHYAIDLRFFRPAGVNADIPSDTPEVRTALQEQLGLRIRASKTTVQTIVIDHIERPSED